MVLRRRYGTLWRYIASEFFFSFLVCFLFFFIIFFINQLLLMAEDILSRKAAFMDVFQLVVFAMPAIIAMSFPFGSLVGALMAAARMASDGEILVMRASGVSRSTIFVPFVVLGLAFAFFSFIMNDVLLPLGTINYGKLYRKLITSAPALELGPYTVKRYRETVIVTGPERDGSLMDVVIMDTTPDGKIRVIGASSARLIDRGDQAGTITLNLQDVFVQESEPSRPDRFEYSSATTMEYNLALAGFADFSSGIGPREMSSIDVLASIREKEAALAQRTSQRAVEILDRWSELAAEYLQHSASSSTINGSLARLRPGTDALRALEAKTLRDRSLDIYRLEYYKKFSIPAGALFFVFLAFPLGVRARRSGRVSGFGVGLLVAVAYWAMLIGGQTLGLRAGLSPFIAMWAPNITVLVLSIPLHILRHTA
ncbi:MAG: LptF/LptG family permease [Spirochaetota bacterium]